MPDYQEAKIYRIVNDNIPDKVYYGSTCQNLSMRMAGHRADYRNTKKYENLTSKQLFESGKPVIVLVENFPCNSKEELHKRERFYIENNSCVNKQIPGRTIKEWREENKELLKQKNKEYNIKNKERNNRRGKEWREKNPEKSNEKMTCECGKTFIKRNITRHNKSARHQEFNLN